MNGINGSTLFENAGFLNANKNMDVAGNKKGMPAATADKNGKSSRTTKALQDIVELNSSASKTQKAGYERPSMQVQKQEETDLKKVDANGVQEGVELSEEAQALLDQLKEKYGKMDFYIAETGSDEEASYYLNQGQKQYSVLIDPETLEKMAADEDVLASYEEVLDGTDEMFQSVKDAVGEENMKSIKSVNVTFDKEGNKSYLVELINDFGQAQKNHHVHDKADKVHSAGKDKDGAKVVRVKSDSIEELVTKIQDSIKKMKEDAKRLEEATEHRTAYEDIRKDTVKKYQETASNYDTADGSNHFFL